MSLSVGFVALHTGAGGRAKRDVHKPFGPISASTQNRTGTDQEHNLNSPRHLDWEPLGVKEMACVFVSNSRFVL